MQFPVNYGSDNLGRQITFLAFILNLNLNQTMKITLLFGLTKIVNEYFYKYLSKPLWSPFPVNYGVDNFFFLLLKIEEKKLLPTLLNILIKQWNNYHLAIELKYIKHLSKLFTLTFSCKVI